MILLLLAFFFRDRVVLVALAAVCESCCGVTLFAGCFMEMSVAVDGGRGSCGVTVAVYTIDFTLHRPFIGQLDVSRQLHGFSSVVTRSSKILLL